MVRHIVMWSFNEKLSAEEKLKNAEAIKRSLEALAILPGVASVKVEIDALPSSNRAIMLNSLFEDEQALDNYQKHPDHLVAGALIKEVMQERTCFDYVE